MMSFVTDHISEKTAVDDRLHSASSTEEQNVVVNMALSLSYADMYKTCIQIAQEKNINAIPSYTRGLCYNSGRPANLHPNFYITLEGFA